MFERYCDYREEYCQYEFPGGSGKLYVNKNGQVFDVNRGVLPIRFNVAGERVVSARLWDGEKDYLVSILVLLVYGKLKLPVYLLNQVEPFFIDNDPRNYHPGNIGYRFKAPIECDEYPGYYYIPFFSNYVISKIGDVKNRENGTSIRPYVIKPTEKNNKKNVRGGYFAFGIKSDVGTTTIGRHRALMLAFTSYPNNVDRLDVNHKNGIPGDDWLDNLEWSTRRNNNLHAVRSGLRSQNIFCYAKNIYTKEELEFASHADCARYFRTETNSIVSRVNSKQTLYNGGWLFKSNKNEPWREVSNPEKELRAQSTPTEIKSMNIFTGEQRVHESIARIAKDLGLKMTQGPKNQLLSGRGRPYYGYLFKYTNDNTPWPEFSSEQLQFYRDNPHGRARAVIAKNDKGEEIYFANIKKVAEHFKDTLRTTKDVCKAISRKRNVNGWYLTYQVY